MAAVTEVAGGTLGSINIGALNANIFLPALSAQLDAAIASGLGPAKLDASLQLNAALAAQATLTLRVGNPLDAIREALAAVVQLQAQLTASLALPTVQLGLSAEIGATAALAGALTAKLGLLDGLIQAALAVKLPAVKFSDGLGNALGIGPAILLAFNGIADGTNLATMGNNIAAKFAGGLHFGPSTINPGDFVSGVILITTAAPVFTQLSVLFAGL
jgi:hypothetical protein